ncbi:hypothetical protein [Pseudomonas putida]|uniref:WYL domain-containing protein n=1 Tax=Pseudomonas putida TaxID=303 RepID=A0A8I1JIK5_PSEPU|nr:hypothetical protein [Pseudomonas putida]MBI6885097.1 hypothetical protein [Pseudomonas putida]
MTRMMSNCPPDFFKSLRNGQAIQARLEWLENRIFWVGELNRSDLVTRFEISPQQASADIKLYQDLASNNLQYNTSRKLYIKAETFEACFEKNLQQWLAENGQEEADLRSIQLESVKPIKRDMGDDVLMAIARSFRLRLPISVLYQSMKSDAPQWRVVCPHTIVETEIRWHIRAFMVEKGVFADLIPGRILEVKDEINESWVGPEEDVAWNTMADIILVPSSTLSADQRLVVERDYRMVDGRYVISTRECLVYYQLSSMYLVDAVREHKGEPQDRNFGLAVSNWKELMKYVKD